MSPKIDIKNLSFTAWDTEIRLLENINLTIHPGERIGITGPSGSGKSTLCYHLAGIHKHALTGKTEGEIWIDDQLLDDIQATDFHATNHDKSRFKAGMIMQNPESQIFSTTVVDEVSYGLHGDTSNQTREALKAVGLKDVANSEIRTLSLGQKQRVVIASFLALNPDLLILDEPTNSLDPHTADQLLQVTLQLNITLIVVEHDLERLVDWADRIVEMEYGRIINQGSPVQWIRGTKKYPRVYQVANAFAISQQINSLPVRSSELLKWAENNIYKQQPLSLHADVVINSTPEILRFDDVTFCYEKAKPVFSHTSFSIKKGEVVALIGLNGSGKTTLLKLMSGLLKPEEGEIYINNRNVSKCKPEDLFGDIGLVFQNPDYQIFDNTVASECGFCLRNHKVRREEIEKQVEQWLTIFRIDHLKNRSPLTLSYGEKRRLTLASVLVAEPKIILLDEPTTALDEENIALLRQLISDLSVKHGKTLCLATHDVDFALDVAQRIIILGNGEILADIMSNDITAAVFSQNQFPIPMTSQFALKSKIITQPTGSWRLLTAIKGISHGKS